MSLGATDLLGYICDTLTIACDLLNAGPGAIIAKLDPCDPAGRYSRCVQIADRSYYVMTSKKIGKDIHPPALLCRFVDLVANRLQSISGYLSTPGALPFLSNRPGPCSVAEWAEAIHFQLQNELVDHYKNSLQLELPLVDFLSSQPYEHESCSGNLVFVEDPNTDLSSCLSIPVTAAEDIPFTYDKQKLLRKLLAGAKKMALLFQRKDSLYLFKGYSDTQQAEALGWSVSIHSTLDWSFCYKSIPLFKVLRSRPQIIRDGLSTAIDELMLEFALSSRESADPLYDLLKVASCQRHGTSVIVADMEHPVIQTWLEGLYGYRRAIRVDRTDAMSDRDIVQALSRKDGALVVDVNTMRIVYAALIADGRAKVNGYLERGARHNSVSAALSDLVLSHMDNPPKVAAVMFSEDGGAKTVCGHSFL